jgi:lysine 2,3-aminomutase
VQTGIDIIRGMRGYTSGLAVPSFVVDLPQGGGKVPLQPDHVVSRRDEELVISNYQGHLFRCHNPKQEISPVALETVFNIEPARIELREDSNADRAIV